MPSNRVVKVRSTGDSVTAQEMRDGIAAIQAELRLSPGFPDEVEKAAAAAAADPRLPELDRTDIELVTIDPEGAKDLDQAMHIERDPQREGGYVVHYAIADVAASFQDLVSARFARQGRLIAALGLGAAAEVLMIAVAILVVGATLLGPSCQRP